MRYVPLERDINIAINGSFWVEVANPEHPFTAMLMSRLIVTALNPAPVVASPHAAFAGYGLLPVVPLGEGRVAGEDVGGPHRQVHHSQVLHLVVGLERVRLIELHPVQHQPEGASINDVSTKDWRRAGQKKR